MKIYKNIVGFILACCLFSCGTDDGEMLPNGNNGGENGNENGNGMCEEITATLSDDVLPIVNQNCAISGCHVSGTGRVNLSVKGNIIQNANQIRDFTQSGFMPAAGSGLSLNDEQKLAIYCWVESGAKDD
jgi:hypothetical protein